jgi:hypothetical protein
MVVARQFDIDFKRLLTSMTGMPPMTDDEKRMAFQDGKLDEGGA